VLAQSTFFHFYVSEGSGSNILTIPELVLKKYRYLQTYENSHDLPEA